MTTDEKVVLESALKLTDALLGESLKHEKHAEKLLPIRKQATELFQKFFAKQEKALLKELKPKLESLAAISESATIRTGRFIETTDEEANKAAAGALQDGTIPLALTAGMSVDYSKLLTSAVEAGYLRLANDHGFSRPIAIDFLQQYLEDNSLMKLTGGLDETTLERLRNALAETYKKGGDYDALVTAIKDEYEWFSDFRAGMIAQTEMNTAYNEGRRQLGISMEFNQKKWNPDGDACVEICIPNVLAGWIGMDEDFPSGDSTPAGHPNCDCSLDVRYTASAE